MEPTNPIMTTFMTENNFLNIIKSTKSFKTPSRKCTDLILVNQPKSFQNPEVIWISASDHHTLIFSFLKTTFTKMPPNRLSYRNCKMFDATTYLNNDSN